MRCRELHEGKDQCQRPALPDAGQYQIAVLRVILCRRDCRVAAADYEEDDIAKDEGVFEVLEAGGVPSAMSTVG